MTMAKKNATAKALQAYMASEKKHDPIALLEWLIACNTNNQRGKVYDQHELLNLYSRKAYDGEHGATKVTHLVNHEGIDFKYIVLKRFREHGHDFAEGNQLIREIECWQELADTDASDMLCPILKYFTSKSDKVGENSETMKRNVIIIAQKAVKVGNTKYACQMAEVMNRENGYHGESAERRYHKMKALADDKGWWDAVRNGGNSGVVFDYAKQCYKAVFIDYAL